MAPCWDCCDCFFFIANSDKLIPLISQKGFLVCGVFLCFSCIFGVLAKIYALCSKISFEVGAAVKQTFLEHFEKYQKEEKKIKEGARFWGISLETGIRMERVLSEFYKPQPKIAVYLANRLLKKHEGNPQVGYILLTKMLNKQSLFVFVQAIFFLGFLISGFIYAAIN